MIPQSKLVAFGEIEVGQARRGRTRGAEKERVEIYDFKSRYMWRSPRGLTVARRIFPGVPGSGTDPFIVIAQTGIAPVE